MQPINQLLKKYDFMNLLKNLSKDIIAPIIVLVVGGYSLYHFTKQDESREINPHSNSGIINNMSTNNGVINNITTGITNQGIQLITRPYQERITTLEQKLTEATISQEEQITLSKELTETREQLKQKQQEINDLNLILSTATTNIAEQAKHLFEEKGSSAALAYLQSAKINQEEQNFKQKFAEKYKLQAQFLIVENQYKSAENSYQKMINYDDSAEALFTYARFLQQQRQFKPAIKKYEKALSKYQTLAKTNPDTYLSGVAMILNNLGILYNDNNAHTKAQSAYEEALEIYRTLAKASPDAYLSGVATILNNLGILYRGNNAHTKAQSAYEEALEIRRTLAKTNPDTYLSKVAMTLNNLGNLYSGNNAHTKAQSAYEEALEIYRTLAKVNPDAYLSEVAMTLNNIGSLYYSNNAHTKAQSAYEEAWK